MDLSTRLSNFFNNRIARPVQQEVKAFPQQATSFGQGLLHQAAPMINNSIVQLGQSPIGQAMVNTQNFIQSPKPISLIPQVHPYQGNNIQSQVGNFAANIPGGIANGIASPILNLGSDFAQTVGRTIGGQGAVPYQNLKSPISRLEYNALGVNGTPQQVLGNLGGTGADLMNYAIPGKIGALGKEVLSQVGKRSILQAIKKNAIEGTAFAGTQGLLSGLDQNRQETLPNQLVNAGIQGIESAPVGTVIGGALGGLTRGAGNAKSGLVKLLMDKHGMDEKTATAGVQQFLRDEAGKFTGKKAPFDIKNMLPNMTAPKEVPAMSTTNPGYSPARGKLFSKSSVRSEPSYYSTLRTAIHDNMPQPGLSIKLIKGQQLQDHTEGIHQLLKSSETPQDAIKTIQDLHNEAVTKGDHGLFQSLKGAAAKFKSELTTGPGLPRDPMNEPVIAALDNVLGKQIKSIPEVTNPATNAIEQKLSTIRPQAKPGSFTNVRAIDNPLVNGPMKGNPEPLPWEQNTPERGNSPTVLENPPTNLSPEKPAYTPGTAAEDPKKVAEQARLASFAQNQSLQFRAENLAQKMDQVLRNPKDNLNLRLALENPAKLDEYASKASDPNAFASIAKEVGDFYDHAFGQAKGQKVKIGEVNDYFTHIWDLRSPESRQIFDDFMAKKVKNFRSGFTKERVFNSINEGLKAGLSLKNEKASNDIRAYTQSLGKQVSNAAFNNKINELRPGGAIPFAENASVPFNYKGQMFEQSNKPGNQGTFIDPEIQKYLGYYSKSAFADNPVISNLDKINTGLKELKLAGGLFHGLRESVNYAGQQLASGHLPDLAGGGRAFWDPNFSRQAQEGFIKDGTLDAASKMGISISNAGGIGDEKSSIMEMAQSKDLIKKATFQRLIPYYILKTVQNLPESSRTPAVGKQIMALYNGLNSEVAGTNKSVSQVARAFFLAPQFNLGKIINVMSAVKGGPEGAFARQALIGTAVATAIEYEIANYVANKKIDMDPKSILSNGVLHPNISLPYKSPTGKALSADLPASNVADVYKTGIGSLLNAGKDAITGNPDQAGADLAQAGTDASHSLTSRTGAALSLANQIASGKDYYGNDINAGNLLQSQLPIPVVQILKSLQNNPKTGKPSQDFKTAALNTAGLRVHNDPNDPANVAQTKYFSDMKKTADSLNANDKGLFMSEIHPTTKDANGNSIVDKNVYTTPAKYDTLLQHPALMAAEIKFQQSQPNHDPLWDWTPQQRQAYMQAQIISKVDPGGDKATTRALYSAIPQAQFDARTNFFNQLQQSGQLPPQAQDQYKVAANPQVNKFWNDYFALPQGSAQRKQMINSPLGQQALAQSKQQTDLTNQQRLDMGLPLLADSSSGGGFGKKKPGVKHNFLASTKSKFKPITFKATKSRKIAKVKLVKRPTVRPLTFSKTVKSKKTA